MAYKFTNRDHTDIQQAAEEELRHILEIAAMGDGEELAYEAYGTYFIIPLEKKFADIPSMQIYVDRVLELDWVKERWPERSAIPIVVNGKTDKNRLQATYDKKRGEILIPPHLDGGRQSWAMREELLLHEISHHFAKGDHGVDFVDTLVEFLGRLIGPYVGMFYQIEISKAREELMSQKNG